MLWGSFGPVHFATLFLAVGIYFLLYFLLRKASRRVQIAVLGLLSFAGIAAVIFNLLTWGSPLEYLPLHLCSLNAMVLPVAVFTRSKTLGNLLLLWSLGALIALVLNQVAAEFEILSWTFFFFYFPHVLEFCVPFLLFHLKLIRPEIRCVGSTLLITGIAYTLIHFFNVWLNGVCVEKNILNPSGEVVQVNYMYSIVPENPVLQLFYNVVPHPYAYMVFAIPIVVVYLCILYFGVFRIHKKKA